MTNYALTIADLVLLVAVVMLACQNHGLFRTVTKLSRINAQLANASENLYASFKSLKQTHDDLEAVVAERCAQIAARTLGETTGYAQTVAAAIRSAFPRQTPVERFGGTGGTYRNFDAKTPMISNDPVAQQDRAADS